MILYAIVKDKFDKNDDWHVMTGNYPTKKDFLFEARCNGFAVMKNKVYTEEEYYNE